MGSKSPRWKGGKRLRPDGYILSYISKGKARLDHRIVAEEMHGPLPKGAIVHHNKNSRQDNSDLTVFASHSEHAKHHANERAFNACGHAEWRKCSICKQYDAPENMTYIASSRSRYHKKCKAQQTAEIRKMFGRKRDKKGRLV